VLSTSGFVNPAARADLDAWVTTYNLNVSCFIDAAGHALGTLNALNVRETTVIVQLPGMNVVWVSHGDVTGTAHSSINAAAQQMHQLLGK
jgi:hypothetical protein